MKEKKVMKKISLNKKTVAHLGEPAMDKLKAGGAYTDDDYTCFFESCLCYVTECTCTSGNPACICYSRKD